MNKNYQLLIEQTSILSFAPRSKNSIEIISENTSGASASGQEPKVIFRAILQTAEERNQNKRYYPLDVCKSIVEQLQQKAQTRSLLMEVDHPAFGSSDPNTVKKRAATIEVKNCGALIRDIKMEGNDIIAEIETLSGFKGPCVAKTILFDKLNIGFSLRALGAVEPQPDGTMLVKQPIKPITFDIVSNPSHINARVLNFLPESAMIEFAQEAQTLYESEDISVLSMDRITICENGQCVPHFIDDIIKERFSSAMMKTTFSLNRSNRR